MLLETANKDDQFNTALGKIQDAIEVLEKLVPAMQLTGSQKTSLSYTAADLKTLADKYATKW